MAVNFLLGLLEREKEQRNFLNASPLKDMSFFDKEFLTLANPNDFFSQRGFVANVSPGL